MLVAYHMHLRGLAENGVGYVYDDNNKDLVGEDVRAKVEELKQAIIDKRIIVKAVR